MDSFSDLFKKENMGQVILGVLFILYLIMGYKMPSSISEMIDTVYGKIGVAVVFLLLFSYANPILGVLGFIVAFELIRRSSITTGSYAVDHYLPTEAKKDANITAMNQFPYTLEQEVVKKMAPIVHTSAGMSKPSYKPLLENDHDASPVR